MELEKTNEGNWADFELRVHCDFSENFLWMCNAGFSVHMRSGSTLCNFRKNRGDRPSAVIDGLQHIFFNDNNWTVFGKYLETSSTELLEFEFELDKLVVINLGPKFV